jgi:hypothetical protein
MLNHASSFQWAVIGAGPAGIAAIGQLLDKNISPEHIIWIDPDFNVGDFGSQWSNVSSNTSVKLFNRFYHHCASFNYEAVAHQFEISQFDEKNTCLLKYAAEPLKWITQTFRETIFSLQKKVLHLELKDHHWHMTVSDTHNNFNSTILLSKNVILAIGSEPKSLQFDNLYEIPLATALDPIALSQACEADDVVAVFGSSHSAIIILKTLLEETNVRQIINFYQEPLRYAVYFEDWILFDDTGLKGNTAKWAREYLHGKMPDRLIRKISDPESIKTFLPQCTKAIYPIGFKRRHITVNGISSFKYNEHNGIIAPGLFGIGIAFPEAAIDRYGTLEYRVGLWKFMDYLTRVSPLWLQYGI